VGVREREPRAHSPPTTTGCATSPQLPQPGQPKLSHISSKNAGSGMLGRSRTRFLKTGAPSPSPRQLHILRCAHHAPKSWVKGCASSPSGAKGGRLVGPTGAGSCAGQMQGGLRRTRRQRLRGSCRMGPCHRRPRQMALLASSAQESCSGLAKPCSEPAGCASPSSPHPGREQLLTATGYPGLPHGCLQTQAPSPKLVQGDPAPCSLPCSSPPAFFWFVWGFFPLSF